MKIKSYASSSRGNLYSVSNDAGRILLEAGLNGRKLTRAVNLSEFDACLISHGHQDHCCGAETLEQRGIKVYRNWSDENMNGFHVPGFYVKPFRTEHDVENPAGFAIICK